MKKEESIEEIKNNNESNEKPEKLHYDEDRDVLVKRKPLPKKLKVVLQHIGFILAIVAVSVVCTLVYFESTQIDLENFYIIGSYRVVSLEKVYPNADLTRTSTDVVIESIQDGRRYEQTVVYDFTKISSIQIADAMKAYLAEAQKKINGFQITDNIDILKDDTNKVYLTRQESKHTISLWVIKDETNQRLTIRISYR